MKKIIPLFFVSLITAVGGQAHAKDTYNGCTFNRAEDINFAWLSYIAATSARHGYDPQPFMYKKLCVWFPNEDFIFSGLASDRRNLGERNDLRVLNVSVHGCTFEMEFGVKGRNFELNSNEHICSNPSRTNGVREIEQQINDDVFSVFCNDGTAGTVDMDSTSGCDIFNGDVQCRNGATVPQLAELICK